VKQQHFVILQMLSNAQAHMVHLDLRHIARHIVQRNIVVLYTLDFWEPLAWEVL
jgi:hypothetical protein